MESVLAVPNFCFMLFIIRTDLGLIQEAVSKVKRYRLQVFTLQPLINYKVFFFSVTEDEEFYLEIDRSKNLIKVIKVPSQIIFHSLQQCSHSLWVATLNCVSAQNFH